MQGLPLGASSIVREMCSEEACDLWHRPLLPDYIYRLSTMWDTRGIYSFVVYGRFTYEGHRDFPPGVDSRGRRQCDHSVSD
jgi:hypothetical protein